jgi:hypothetical protein
MRRAAAAVLLALLAAGCAGTGSGSAAPPPPTNPPTSAAPTAAPTTGGGRVTVDGVIERGVEPGCMVLRTGTKSYLLQGAQASSAPVAVPVRVTGELVENVASYCQQGVPLQVTTLTRR